MEYFDSIKLQALASVVDPDNDDIWRDIFEWYSVTFHTPLHQVPDLPLDDVLLAYYRHLFREMEPEERHNTAIWLLETPEERKARKENDSQADDEFLRKAQEANAKKAKKPSQAALAFQRMKNQKLGESDGLGAKPSVTTQQFKPLAETSLPEMAPGQEVTISYMSAADFEAELDKPIGPPPKKKG